MSKLFVAFIFAAFAFNFDHIIEAVEPKSHDEITSTITGNTTTDRLPSVNEEQSTSEIHPGDTYTDELSPVAVTSSTLESYPDYIRSSSYEPLILKIKKNKIDTIFATSGNSLITLNTIQILSEKESSDEFSPDIVKIYLCPQGTWLERLGREYKPHRKIAMFPKNFSQDEAHQCSIEPQYMVTHYNQDSDPVNCIKRLGLEILSVYIMIAYPVIKKTMPNSNKTSFLRYRETMEELIKNVDSGNIQNEAVTIANRSIEMYEACYDPQRKRANWIIRRITPWVQVERDLKKQEEQYAQKDDSETTFHKIVPSDEYSFKMWERVTSDEPNNYVLVWLKLKPLIDLIDERLEKYSKLVFRSIKVMTKLVYPENVAAHQEPKLRGNHTYYRPELLIIQAYDREANSAITFVLHNSLENVPKGSPFCKKPEKCDFMQWIEVSSIFENYINDELTKVAYCCISISLYKMLTNTEKVMELNRFYEPLIIIMNENQTDKLFTIPTSNNDVIPFGSIQILSEKESTNELNQKKEKIYFCPNRTWQNKLKVKETLWYTPFTLLQKHFSIGEAHRCSIQPRYISSNLTEEHQPTNCLSKLGLTFQKIGIQIAYPLIEEKTQETKEKVYKRYINGMDELINDVHSGNIQNEFITVATRMIEMYQLCVDNKTMKTHWIIREITPRAQIMQEELYSQEHNSKSGTTLHKIVPSEENSFEVWKEATTYKYNNVPVAVKVKPLIDLIDERLQKYSRQVSRSIKVMTKLVYHENVTKKEETIQTENLNYLQPELLLIQAYDEVLNSAITFVIHNTFEKLPEEGLYCKETAECDFMKWFEKSSIFEKYINDSMATLAYCCKTMKDEFPMLLNIKIVEVMEINTIYEPVILKVEMNQIDTLFPIQSSEYDVIPFSSIQILSKKQSTDQLNLNEVKIYFCPHRTWLNKLKFEDTQHIGQFSLFETHLSVEDEHRCSIQPRYISRNPTEKYQPTNCLSTQGLIFQEVGIQIAYPLIEERERTPETEDKVFKRYTEGIDELIKNVNSGQMQNEVIKIASRMIEIYQLCYNKQKKKTDWIIREITPWAQVQRDIKNQETRYAQKDNNDSGTILHEIVPSEEHSFQVWKHATDDEHNRVLVSLKLKPLIDLIDESLQKYSKHVYRSIKVMTRLVYHENVTEVEVATQNENPNYWRPKLMLIQAYDEDEKSAITIVIHNSAEQPPEEGLHCKEKAECNFMKWFEKSSIFEKYINDSVTKLAYCCKTMKDEFPMLLNIEITEVMEINTIYEPVIVMLNEKQIHDMFYYTPSSEHNIIPFSSIQILSEKQLTHHLGLDNMILYFCPHKTWLNKLKLEDIHTGQLGLFRKHFDKDEAHRCSIQPKYKTLNPTEEYQPTNCLSKHGLTFQKVGIQITKIFINEKGQGNVNDIVQYVMGMDALIYSVKTGNIQKEAIIIAPEIIEMYQLCYDEQRKKTYWIIREITPWAQVQHDLKKQEELYTQGEKSNSGITLHKIIPTKENSFKIWEHATSNEHNHVLVSLKLKPLIDLIDESLQKYSRQALRSIKIMTKLVYNENVAESEVAMQKKHSNYWRPELLLIQAYDQDEKSAITFVIHNSPENPPEGKLYCKETAECNFIKWFKMSSIFEKYIDNTVAKLAYCCKTMKDEFPMLLDIEIKEVMEINTMYEPLILMVKENQIDILFPMQSSIRDAIPLGSIQILSEKQSGDQLNPNKVKIYFCPHRTWLNKLKFEDTKESDQSALFKKQFDEDEAHRCTIQPWYISWNPLEKYRPINCLSRQGLTFQKVGIQISYILIKQNIPGMEKEVYKRYSKGLDELIDNVKGGKIQNEVIKVASRMIEMYQLCYDKQRKKTHWITREITPWAQVERDLKKQEELYAQEDNAKHTHNLETTAHKIVPREEYSFKIWEHAASDEHNYALVLLKLKPLIDLIDERLVNYSKQVFRSIKVMTKLVYNENETEENNGKQKENQNYWRPELLLVQAYDEVVKSAITFVIQNSLEKPPEGKFYCKKTAECDFMTWFEKSSIFEKYINDTITNLAYCCETMKDEYPMLLNIEINEVMEINNMIYEPIILMLKESQIDTLFPIQSSKHDVIPLSSIQILSKEQSTNELNLNEVKIYYCPHRTWLNKLKFEDTQHIGQFLLFEKHLSVEDEHKCSTQPWYISTNPTEEYQPLNCLSAQGLTFQEVGFQIAYPLIEEKTSETKDKVFKRYTEGIDELIKNVDSGQIQNEVIKVASRMIEMYQLCYDKQRKKTYWMMREITPLAQVERDLKKQEELYSREDTNSSEVTLHKIIPSEENSFKIWKHATSAEYNQVLVLLKLKPLIDLIDERLEKYSRQVSRSIKVMTKLVYNENETKENEGKQKENQNYSRPELLLVQAYDEVVKSAITFVIHNSLENPPEGSPLCKTPTECNFMKWFEIPSIFEKYINDTITNLAYCCETMKDEYPMLLNIEINEVMEMNLDSTMSHTT